jgi:tetratricopeptide (TPR) repeat protein
LKKYYFLLLILTAGLYTGCSSGTGSTTTKQDVPPAVANANYREAMNRFIDGTAAEAKGEYAGAIVEYLGALNYDHSGGIYYSLAKNYFFLGKIGESLQYARVAVQKDSLSTEYLLLLQEIFTAARLQDSAALTLEKILKIDPNESDAIYKLAKLYETTKPQQSIILYKKLLKDIGPEWTVLVRVAELYERLGDLNGAVQTLEDLLSLDPENKNLEKLLVDYYVKTKQFDKAHAKLDELLQLYPEDEELTRAKGETLIEQGKFSDAAQYYQKMLALPKLTLDAKIRIGEYFYMVALKDSTLLGSASEIFGTIDKDTTDWQVKMYLGAIAVLKRQDSIAIPYFETAAELAPWNAEAWTRLGGLLFDNKRYKDVVTTLSHVVAKFPEEFGINLILGLSYLQLEQYADGAPFLEKAVDLNPKDINALSAYSYSLSKLKNYEKAIELLRQALALDSANVDLMANLGLIYDDREMWSDCDSIYSAALKINPNNALILNNYAYSLSKRSIKLDEAIDMVSRALVKEPTNSSYLDTKGWIYFQMKKYPEARKFIEQSLNISGDKQEVLDHLAEVINAMGDKETALEIWKKAYNLDTGNESIKKKIERESH